MIQSLILLLVFLPLILGIPGYFIAKKWPKCREWFFIGVNLLEMILMVVLDIVFIGSGSNSISLQWVMGMGLSFKVDAFRAIYSTVSIFLWLMTITFSKEYMQHYAAKERYYLFYLITLTGVVGVFLSNDLVTTFTFFELMSFASYPLVIHEEKEEAMKAGETYLAIAVISGMILLVGLFFLQHEMGTLDFESIKAYVAANGISPMTYAAGILLLFGFGAKAGMYPLHIWLPKAHPVAPAPASALLSGILTKTGVYGIIVIAANIFLGSYSFGVVVLIFAVITMFLGALLALFSVNLKRTLACSSMSQVGFILVGIAFMILLGEEGSIAQCGALLHMVNHSLIKLVLFMAAGVVAMNIHALELNEIRGFGRKKPFLMIVFLIGSLGIMGIPGFNGYVSKTMIHESITEYMEEAALTGGTLAGFKAVEWIFLISGGLTVAYMSKLFICLFVEKNESEEKQKEFDAMTHYMSPLSKGVFVLSTVLIPVIGILPNIINLNVIAKANEFFGVEEMTRSVSFYGWNCLQGGLISIGIGILVYVLLVRFVFIQKNRYINLWAEKLDLETLVYRPLVIKGTIYFTYYIVRVFALGLDYIILLLNKTVLRSHVYQFDDHSLAYKVGDRADKKKKSEIPHYYAGRVESMFNTMMDILDDTTSSFSFAFIMISLGMIIVLLAAVFLSL